MTCKDCVHYQVCAENGIYFTDDYIKGITIHNDVRSLCQRFKNIKNFVEVVRCKDCRYKKVGYMQAAYYYCCRQGSGFHHIKENDFCRYGKRNSWDKSK